MENIPYKNIYFIGIGGIGMSAVARMLKESGIEVSGSDVSSSEVTEGLKKEGIRVHIGEDKSNLAPGIDCVIYTLAISDDNKELTGAYLRNIPVFTYSEMLGKITGQMETVAVAGTHGKTTVTAMISSAFYGINKKPHVIVGSLLSDSNKNNIKTNYLKGDKKILITEACEYKRSFLNLSPKHIAITNIDEDHLDYYRDLSDIQDAFIEFCNKLPEDGKIICNPNLPNLKPVVEKFKDKIIDYMKFLPQVPELKVLGEHNKLNGAVSLAMVSIFESNLLGVTEALKEFSGTWRRLESRGQYKKPDGSDGAILYDDYAHHPDEISASFNALSQKFSDKKISIFFHPHLYSRTRILFDDFVKVFGDAVNSKKIECLYLLPIYAAREPQDLTISSKILAKKIAEKVNDQSKIRYLNNFYQAAEIIKDYNYEKIAVTMGAGSIYKILDLI